MSNRTHFRRTCLERDGEQCIVPWCSREADEVHHILERELWDEGGYIPDNGASVCNHHHQYAETNDIPPQAFWMWAGVTNPPTPDWDMETKEEMRDLWNFDSVSDITDDWNVNKWGEPFDRPPHEDRRDHIKYQSSRHLLPLYWHDDETVAEERTENDDTGLETIDDFVGVPLVITHKIDGGNCTLVSDVENPVRARNGSRPEPNGTMRPLYRDEGLYWQQKVHQKLPDRLQVFGEWVWAKHSIHYGCDCDDPCEDIGPGLSELTGVDDDRAYFQIFGVYDTGLNLWLSWPETERVAETLGFPTTPVIHCEDDSDAATFETEHEARRELISHARRVIENGGEGIVVRSKFPFHWGQFEHRLGKYVRENHVKDDEPHWRKQPTIQNCL